MEFVVYNVASVAVSELLLEKVVLKKTVKISTKTSFDKMKIT